MQNKIIKTSVLALSILTLGFSVGCLAGLTPDDHPEMQELVKKRIMHKNTYMDPNIMFPGGRVFCEGCGGNRNGYYADYYERVHMCEYNKKAWSKYLDGQAATKSFSASERYNKQDALIRYVADYSRSYNAAKKCPSVNQHTLNELEKKRIKAIRLCKEYDLDWPTDYCPTPSDLGKK